jgi:hypothetical protein
MGRRGFFFPNLRISPISPQSSEYPACSSSLPSLWPIPRFSRGPSLVPIPSQSHSPPNQECPFLGLREVCGLVPTCPSFSLTVEMPAGNTHLWVSSANTLTSLNSLDAQSGAPVPNSLRFLRQHPPTMALSSPDTPPPPTLSAPSPRQQREVKVPRRSWCPSLFPGESSLPWLLRAPPAPPGFWWQPHPSERCWPPRSGMNG